MSFPPMKGESNHGKKGVVGVCRESGRSSEFVKISNRVVMGCLLHPYNACRCSMISFTNNISFGGKLKCRSCYVLFFLNGRLYSM